MGRIWEEENLCEDFGQGNRQEMHLKLLGKKGKTNYEESIHSLSLFICAQNPKPHTPLKKKKKKK